MPATRPERILKALDGAADGVIVDLEDAVAPQEKALARELLASVLAGAAPAAPGRLIVRINGQQTPWHDADVAAVTQLQGKVTGVMLAKAESRQVLESLHARFEGRMALIPLVESLAGLDALDLLARAPCVARLAFGHLDFQVDLGMQCEPGEPELVPARFAIVAASRRATLPAPIDGVTTETRDLEVVARDAARSKAMGFGAKMCIHPAQVPIVNEALGPRASEVEWASRVVAAAESAPGGVFTLDGRMVDLPVIRLARRILESSGAA